MAERLQKHGWTNYGICSLFKQCIETTNHLFVSCRFTTRIWELILQWLGLEGIHPRQWRGLSIKYWWSSMADGASPQRKALAPLSLLIVWEIWNERNARVFRSKQSPSFVLVDKVKAEACLWVIAGAKKLGYIMPGE
jgi:hypothetical protein